jgi:hypothetical protein
MMGERETLSWAVDNLEQALAQPALAAGAWAGRVGWALAQLEQAIHRQDTILESPEGEFVEVESGQWPSQGMDRRVAHLHEELAGLLAEAEALRVLVHAVPEEGVDSAVGDDFRRRAAALVECLHGYEQEEFRLILESATTDIGAGD